MAGSAAGIVPAAGLGAVLAPGHVPDTRTAWAWMPSSDAASSSGVFPPPPAGRAGSAPGDRPSGSDQIPCQKPKGAPASAEPIADRRVSVVVAMSAPEKDPFAVSAVPGAATRSCRTVWGSACPANAASAAATAAATRVVRAAAAITTQCAPMRRAGRGPRGANTSQRIPYEGTAGNSLFNNPAGVPVPRRLVSFLPGVPPSGLVSFAERVPARHDGGHFRGEELEERGVAGHPEPGRGIRAD